MIRRREFCAAWHNKFGFFNHTDRSRSYFPSLQNNPFVQAVASRMQLSTMILTAYVLTDMTLASAGVLDLGAASLMPGHTQVIR